MEEGIKEERKRLKFLRERADYLIDSSHMLTRELRAELSKIFVENKEYKNLYISVLSFGFKYGIPADADLVFDVRFLPNPYYIDELRPKSGNDKEVREYVMDNDKARIFLAKLTDMVEFLIPNHSSIAISRSESLQHEFLHSQEQPLHFFYCLRHALYSKHKYFSSIHLHQIFFFFRLWHIFR